jgi:RNA polymerase sigma-70 factor (ECF subfamily)
MTASVEETALVRAAQAGDAQAIMGLVERLQPTIYRFGRRMCPNEQDAEDVLQETLLTLVQRIGEFRGDASLSSWLFTIVRSRCRIRRRASDRVGEAEGTELLDSAPHPEEAASSRQLRAILEGALRRLEPKYREVLLLRDVEGLSAPEVGEALGLTVSAVKSRLHRARAMVREEVETVLERRGIPRPELPPDVPRGLELGEMLSRYLDGELTGAQCELIEQHLVDSTACRGTCDNLRRLLGECRAWGSQVPPERVTQSVRAAIRSLLESRAQSGASP